MNNTQLKYKSTNNRLGAILLIFTGLFNLLFAIYGNLPFHTLQEKYVHIVSYVIYDVMYLAAFMIPAIFVPVFFKKNERQPMRLAPTPPKSTFALILIGLAITYAFSYVNSIVVTNMFGDSATEPLFQYPATYMSNSQVILEFITVALVPAFCEEFLFRGVILSTLMPYGKSTAVIFSAVCFGLMHGNFSQFLYTTVAGIILGAVYVATDSIWPSTIIHMINNALAVLQIVLYERLSENYAYVIWLLIVSVIMIAGIVSLVYLIRRAKKKETKIESIYGAPLDRGECAEFSANADLLAKDAVRGFFSPTIIAFLAVQILFALYLLGASA